MVGRAYAIFDTAIGRCGIVWSNSGVVAVQLPEAREIDTRRRIFQVHPEAREQPVPLNAELAIEGIAALLQGSDPDFSDVSLDCSDVPVFNRRVYEYACTIPRGETRTYYEIAKALGASGAAHSVAQAIAKNLYADRALPPRAGDRQLRRPAIALRRSDLQAAAARAGGRPSGRQQDAVRSAAAGCPAEVSHLDSLDGCDHAVDVTIDDGLRVPLRCGTGR